MICGANGNVGEKRDAEGPLRRAAGEQPFRGSRPDREEFNLANSELSEDLRERDGECTVWKIGIRS